jgi:hypothetical protein
MIGLNFKMSMTPHYFGDQGNHAKIQMRHDQLPSLELTEHRHDHPLNLLLKSEEESYRKAIQPRDFDWPS